MRAQVVSATPRQLESLVRLSEALARMRLAPTVEAADVAEALRLMRARPARLALRKGCAACELLAKLTLASLVHACCLLLQLANPVPHYTLPAVLLSEGEAGLAAWLGRQRRRGCAGTGRARCSRRRRTL